MSAASRHSESFAQWRKRTRHRRRALARRIAFDRWYPHLVIAAAMAPAGLLFMFEGVEDALGDGSRFTVLAAIEERAHLLELGAVFELAIGVSLLAMSVGVALRSRLAWLWSVGATGGAVALRLPPVAAESLSTIYVAGVLLLLLVNQRSFASRGALTSTVFAVVALVTFFLWATIGTLRLGDQFAPPVRDLETALYLSVVTTASVGFGEIVPATPEARMFVVAEIALGIIVGATALGAILLPLIGGRLREIVGGKARVDRSNHYVIVGESSLARNATLELEKRGQRVTLVLHTAPAEDFYKERDVVVGDATDLSVLRTAKTEDAKGVLALTTDDATNGFVVLGVNELDATIPTVATLNDPANRFRLNRTQPSMVLSLQTLGGELLAMALTGEKVDVGMLSRVLQLHGDANASEDKNGK